MMFSIVGYNDVASYLPVWCQVESVMREAFVGGEGVYFLSNLEPTADEFLLLPYLAADDKDVVSGFDRPPNVGDAGSELWNLPEDRIIHAPPMPRVCARRH